MAEGPKARSLLRFDRFVSEELEAHFQQEYLRPTIEASRLWAAVAVVAIATNAYGAVYNLFRPLVSGPYWAAYGVQAFCVAVILFITQNRSTRIHQLRATLCMCYCLWLAAFAWQLCLGMQIYQAEVALLPGIGADADSFIVGEMTFLVVIYFYLIQQPLTLPLLQIGFCPASLISILGGPLMYILMACVGLPLQRPPFTLLPGILLIAAVQVFYCRRFAVLRRSVFVLELQKAHHTQEMRDVDGAIHHIVKNAMTEAAGLTEMFLDLCTPPPPQDLVQPYLLGALERLRSGMAWCKRRRVLTELLDAVVKPNRVPTSLLALGMALASHRPMTTDFADLEVELDDALTDLLLENAINNAYRHGHPTDPAVNFRIDADLADASESTYVVTFRVMNRCDPNRQPLPPDLLDRLRHADGVDPVHATLSCRGLGLRHSLLAAELQGMTVSLAQEGEFVVFKATLVARAVPRPPMPASPSCPAVCVPGWAAPPLPTGLRITVIDDSAAARTLLCHQLRSDIPGCEVEVFGASAEDVEPFLNHTLAGADITILDQHLNWPSGRPGLGTDLVWQLQLADYAGMICIRSAQMNELDVQTYFAAGAHCVLDKLLERAQMTATLATHYWQFYSSPNHGLDSNGAPLPGFISVM
eukprot:EG_transcript_1982